jgi:transcriptional regulator with XRE-family HTH domain
MRAARLEAGLRQSDLADLMATSRTTITRMESGRDFPQIATLERWAELTGKQLEIRLV